VSNLRRLATEPPRSFPTGRRRSILRHVNAATALWTCPTCGGTYPADFAVCPKDATPRADGAAPNVDPMIGEVLARTYRIVRMIGEGGMARLYEAEHLRVETRYAVKIIHDDLSRNPDLLARFEREARAAGKIRSDHVVRVIDVLRTSDGRPCIVTELLEGQDLQAHLNKVGKLSPREAIPIARQICRALDAAHKVGVVHRDLKPSNVFLCNGPDEMVKVFDFGVAKLEDDDRLTRTDAVMGTPAYMAPEQARRAVDAGPLADLYTIGAVLYHMLTGEPPYGKAPASSRLALVLHEEPARPRTLEPSIPDGLEAVMLHAMARLPEARVQTAMELDAGLAAFDTSTPTAAAIDTVSIAEIGGSAAQIERRARSTRPIATAIVSASALVAGLWIATASGAILGASDLSNTGRALIGLLAVGAAMATAMVQIRMLRPRWRSVPSVLRHVRPVTRVVVTAIATFGALELAVRGVDVITGWDDGGVLWRIGLTLSAAVVALVWKPRKG
jgi:tRNA A-37 threonylcarbamoyl transferase component Bud32